MSDGGITEHERARVVQLLGRTRDAFLAAVECVTDDQWCFRPIPEGWSIGLIAEHLGLVERGLFGRVEQALRSATHPEWQTATGGKDAVIETMLADRNARKDAPDAVVPTGTVARHDALQIFQQRRAQSLAFAETTTAPLRAHAVDHHRPTVGTLNAYQWLLYIPLHNQRHIRQISGIKAATGYPMGA